MERRASLQFSGHGGSGWRELPMDKRYTLGFPSRAFIHKSNLAVISAVEVVSEPGMDKGFEYHISISKQRPDGEGTRCDSNEAKWVLDEFGLDGAEEDNHVPYGVVRNFWRPVLTGWSVWNAHAKKMSRPSERTRAISCGVQQMTEHP